LPHGLTRADIIDGMTVVRINAITVPADSGDELARRFAARAGAVDDQGGFEGFELLKPTDGRTTWLVVTRWRDEESFEAWRNSAAFGRGHQSGTGHGAGQGGDAGHGAGRGGDAGGHGADAGEHGADAGEHGARPGGGEARPPVGISSELWSYDVAGGSAG
jgi:heme oxygenase (mycobilin-producing)